MIIVIKYDNYNKTRFYLFVSSRGEVSSIGLNVFKIEPCVYYDYERTSI